MSLDSISDVSIGNIDTILIHLREQVYQHSCTHSSVTTTFTITIQHDFLLDNDRT